MRLIDESLWNAAIYAVEYLNDNSLLRKLIAEAEEPTIEADDMVKVVRCRDCTHGSKYDDGSDNYVCGYGGTKKGSGFCSDGERRKEDEYGVD